MEIDERMRMRLNVVEHIQCVSSISLLFTPIEYEYTKCISLSLSTFSLYWRDRRQRIEERRRENGEKRDENRRILKERKEEECIERDRRETSEGPKRERKQVSSFPKWKRRNEKIQSSLFFSISYLSISVRDMNIAKQNEDRGTW